MKLFFLFFIGFIILPQPINAKDFRDCELDDNGSLWVKNYNCADGTEVSVGSEMFNDSMTVRKNRKTTQYYKGDRNKPSFEYLKNLRRLNYRQ